MQKIILCKYVIPYLHIWRNYLSNTCDEKSLCDFTTFLSLPSLLRKSLIRKLSSTNISPKGSNLDTWLVNGVLNLRTILINSTMMYTLLRNEKLMHDDWETLWYPLRCLKNYVQVNEVKDITKEFREIVQSTARYVYFFVNKSDDVKLAVHLVSK